MTFDPASLLDVSHLVSFLGGGIVGAAGTYMADKYTDQRRRQEGDRAERKQLAELRKLMPELLDEIAADLRSEHGTTTREFVVLPGRGVIFNHDKQRFEYFETEHADVQNRVDMLCNAGFVEVIKNTGTRIYRLREAFVSRLLA